MQCRSALTRIDAMRTGELPAGEAGEVKLLEQMNDAIEGLKACGWKEAIYCPKDGTRFLAIEAGSTGVFPCYWMTNKHMAEGGGFWSEAHGDLWPAKPTLWKPMPSNAPHKPRSEAESA